MKIKFISYGYKYYEELGEAAPKHDFLFHLRDLPNPYWDEGLRDYCGLDPQIIKYFEESELTQKRLNDTLSLVKDFSLDFINNKNREESDFITFAFRCTGGKHRSVYFAESAVKYMKKFFSEQSSSKNVEIELEHIDLARYARVGA